jgi:hypothetical protein
LRRLGKALGFVDEFVFVAIVLAGAALMKVVAAGGASSVQVGLVLLLTVWVAGWWAFTSNAGETLADLVRRWRARRDVSGG